ncbi:MAG: hypothetical protein KAT12_08785 [Gammaproteobacteria bacterium]|nr:hypothetical protein [Gammaproteobacteria bacterium]
MSDELFDVVFFGIIQAGKDKETVMQNMAALFKTDAAKLAPYFAGGRKVIKGKINAAAAEKYRAALENVGLTIKIEPCETESDTPQAAPQTEQSNGSDSSTDTGNISIAPVGADVIENPVETPAQKIDDISNITMAEAGADVIENPVEPPAQKIEDISGITMAEAGTDVLDHHEEITPQKIDDIAGISLAEAGSDLIENPKPAEKAPVADTSELSLDAEPE